MKRIFEKLAQLRLCQFLCLFCRQFYHCGYMIKGRTEHTKETNMLTGITVKEVADRLEVEPAAIARFEEWVKVILVIVKGRRPIFLSKKAFISESASINPVTASEDAKEAPQPQYWTLKASVTRKEGRYWVAQITGQYDQFVFKRKFLVPTTLMWGQKGMKLARFQIDTPGYYQDSDGDFFHVFLNEEDNTLDARECSRDEVKHHFYHN